jgi:hypothetical protein
MTKVKNSFQIIHHKIQGKYRYPVQRRKLIIQINQSKNYLK